MVSRQWDEQNSVGALSVPHPVVLHAPLSNAQLPTRYFRFGDMQ